MKRLFIGLLAVGCLSVASAQNLIGSQPENLLGDRKEAGAKATRAGELGTGNWFGYCNDYYQGIGTGTANTSLEAAIEIPANMAEAWKGAQLTKMNIGIGTTSNLDVMIYLTESLTGVPFYTENVTLQKEEGWNEVTLSTPYTFDGKPFYVGYQIVTLKDTDYPIGMDGYGTYLTLGDYVGVNNAFYNMGTQFGSVCIQIEVSGTLPQYGAIIDELTMPEFVVKDAEFQGYFTIINTGTESITDLNVTAKVGGVEMEQPIVSLFEGEEIPFGSYTYILVRGLYAKEVGANIPVELTVNELVGPGGVSKVDLGPLSTFVISASELFDRNVVVEEFTGTWCGWCPRGIVGMEYMKEKYGDKGFIGIAVHTGNDPMTVAAYQSVVDTFSDGAPSATMDRQVMFDPNIQTLEAYFEIQSENPSPAKVNLKALYDMEKNVVNCEATSEFAFDYNGAPYRLVFVIIEDNVGPYAQTNYYAGGQNGPMDGWESKKATASTVYNEVARYIDSDFGIPGSIPSMIQAATPYTYEIELPTTNCLNVNNCSVIAMIVDTKTYEVMNATKVSLEGQAGVEDLIAPVDDTYHVFNLQGVKVLETKDASAVSSLPSGIYIINGKKVLL